MKTPDKILAVLLLSALASSCSIKEDRSLCPACLKVVMTPASVRLAGDGTCRVHVDDRLQAAEAGMDSSKPWAEFEVAKDSVRLCSWLEAPAGYPASTQYVIGEGRQCDSLWAFAHAFLASAEEVSDSVSLHKRFLTLTVRYSAKEAEGGAPYDMKVVSATAGTDLKTLGAIRGHFSCDLDFGDGDLAAVRLPWQGDPSSLRLMILEKGSGETVDVFPLGDELTHGLGYDWNAADLADVTLSMDFTRLEYSVGVSPWDEGGNDDKTL